MQVVEATNKNFWNGFVATYSSPSSFLQSWEWGEFQEALGNKVYRFVVEDKAAMQIIVKKLPLGRTYLEVPKGPVMKKNLEFRIWNQVVEKLGEVGRKERAVLGRVNPPYQIYHKEPESFGFRRPEILLRQREPEHTILVDLTKSEDELLAQMHEKSRYNIRLAQRKGLKVRQATQDRQAFEHFLDLLAETIKRDKIVSWPRKRFWKFREVFLKDNPNQASPYGILLVGELNGKILAGAIVIFFGNAGTYLYAASSGEDRPANAPSLVLWEAIRETKRQGRSWYDMWGIAPQAEPNHPWAGITRFKSRYVKLGVTGKEIRNVGTLDLVLNRTFYSLFKIGKAILG